MPILKNKKQKADCLITLPNSTVHYVSISEDSTGHDCIEKVIIEMIHCKHILHFISTVVEK